MNPIDEREGSYSLKEWWAILGRPIFVGDRLKANLMALTGASVVTMILGFVLLIMNVLQPEVSVPKLIMSNMTLLAGAGCAYLSYFRKDRKTAVVIPTLFCCVVFTFYALTGYAEGTGILWSILLPIGMCYFVGIRYGIILSVYYSVLYTVVFYTPLGNNLRIYYTDAFCVRFPMMYAALSAFTIVAMIQYHRTALFEIDHTNRLNEEVERQTAVAEERSRKIEQMSFQTIQTLANAIDAKDPYTKGHSTRVSLCSVAVAEELGWDKERVNDLRYAALLHDIGKIGVPDSILNKPRKLTDVEYDIIKSHTTMGADILRDRIIIEGAEDVARSHHERYDGTGYPNGLKGEEISEEARIVAIADAFDAMNSNRVYRKACDREYILREMTAGKGKQFDPRFTDVFLKLWTEGKLDAILTNDGPEEKGLEMEASSALLQEVMEAFASQTAADQTDVTTGLMSRTSGETAIAGSMKEDAGCLVFFDMDNLKRINDTNGHEAGDRALRLMGEILQENGEGCLCCRLGGDEFLFFMKNVTREEAEEKVRKIIGGFNEKKNADAGISAASLSAGMAMCTPADSYTTTYNRADKALYHVKQNGKSDCSFYNDDADSFGNRLVDVNSLVRGIRDSGCYQGAMDVEYRQFAKLYEYVTNLEKRFDQHFRLIMITMENSAGDDIQLEELEKAMFCMEQAIRQTIRNVDVLTRYSRQQFLIILLGTDPEGVRIAVDRIFKGYYKMNGGSAFTPSWSAADPIEEVAQDPDGKGDACA